MEDENENDKYNKMNLLKRDISTIYIIEKPHENKMFKYYVLKMDLILTRDKIYGQEMLKFLVQKIKRELPRLSEAKINDFIFNRHNRNIFIKQRN